jgi:hypothetical protein
VRIWSTIATRQEFDHDFGPRAEVLAVAFAEDGRLLALVQEASAITIRRLQIRDKGTR